MRAGAVAEREIRMLCLVVMSAWMLLLAAYAATLARSAQAG